MNEIPFEPTMTQLILSQALDMGFTKAVPERLSKNYFQVMDIEEALLNYPDEKIILCNQKPDLYELSLESLIEDISDRVYSDISDNYSSDCADYFEINSYITEQVQHLKSFVNGINESFKRHPIWFLSEYYIVKELPHDEI